MPAVNGHRIGGEGRGGEGITLARLKYVDVPVHQCCSRFELSVSLLQSFVLMCVWNQHLSVLAGFAVV